MSSVVQYTDFEQGSYYELPQNDLSVDQLESTITVWEQRYLTLMLGVELYTLFIADLANGVPQTQRFIDIYEPFSEDYSGCVLMSDGIKAMLLGMIWGQWASVLDVELSMQGNKVNNNANTTTAGMQNSRMYDLYNKGVDTFRQIQHKICRNQEDYPEFNGQTIEKKYWF